MSGLIAFFAEQLRDNQILQAAIVAAPMTALTYAARRLPAQIWRAVRRAITIEVAFNSDMADYQAVADFVSEHVIDQRWSRVYAYHAERGWDDAEGANTTRHHGLQAGYGDHWGRFGGRWVIVRRWIDTETRADKFKERLSVTFFAVSRGIARRFADALRAHVAEGGGEEHIRLFLSSGSWWRPAGTMPLRGLSTVFTAGGEGQRLLDHVRAFEAARDRYRARGTPWHTGALLIGPPGTGKTSLIHAIASETRRSIRYLTLGGVEGDRQLVELIAQGRDWRRALLVIEDADASNVAIEPRTAAKSDDEGDAPRAPVSLSTMLNALDGLITPDGLVVIATTNHPERLDPALRRPGRFDLTIALGPLDFDAFAAMARLFGVGDREIAGLAAVYRPETGATLRALLNEGGIAAVRGHFMRLSVAA